MDVRLEQQLERQNNKKSITATATLTEADILKFSVFSCDATDGAIVLTLPAASAAMEDAEIDVDNFGTSGTKVYVAAGFGGNTSNDTISLTANVGEYCKVKCNGTYWLSLHHTPPASS